MQDSSTSQCLPLRKKRYRSATIALLFALAGCSWPALAQVMNTTSESSEYSPSQSSATSIPSSVGSLNQNPRSEEHTSELQSPCNLVCRLLLEKKKIRQDNQSI